MTDMRQNLPGSNQCNNQGNRKHQDKKTARREWGKKKPAAEQEAIQSSEEQRTKGASIFVSAGKVNTRKGFTGGGLLKSHYVTVAILLAFLTLFSSAVPSAQAMTEDGRHLYFSDDSFSPLRQVTEEGMSENDHPFFRSTTLLTRILSVSSTDGYRPVFSDAGFLRHLWEILNMMMTNGNDESLNGEVVQKTQETSGRARRSSDSNQGDNAEPPPENANPGNPGEDDPEDPGSLDPADPGEDDPEDPGSLDPADPGEEVDDPGLIEPEKGDGDGGTDDGAPGEPNTGDDSYDVTIESSEGGSVAFHSSQDNEELSLTIKQGEQVTVVATPDELYQFSHWSPADDPETKLWLNHVYSFNMPEQAVSVKAHFEVIHPFEGGTGKAGDPYQIKTARQLIQLMGNSPQLAAGYVEVGFQVNLMEAHYKLADDIDLKDIPWSPIGGSGANAAGSAAFTGVFDGNKKTISNLRIDQPNASYQAMFHTIGSGAIVRNLTLEDPMITAKSHAAALAVNNHGLIQGVLVESAKIPVSPLDPKPADPAEPVVVVNVGVNSDAYCGGLVTFNGTTGTIHQSGVRIAIRATGQFSGLLVAENRGGISESYSIGSISGGGSHYQGGLVGYNNNRENGVETFVENSYAISILSDAGNFRGGVIGGQYRSTIDEVAVDKQISIKHVYGATTMGNMTGAGIGGVLGGNGRDMLKSYFDADLFISSQNTNEKKGIPLAGGKMKIKSSFVETDNENNGWNFSTIWDIDVREDKENAINTGYPYLRWQYSND